MKAIIFGITGQDGSHLADLLLEKDYKVVGVCRRASTDNTGRIKHILNHPSFSVFQGDITDAHSVIKVLKEHADVDEIYNLAAQSHVAVSFKQPGLTWDITGKGCLNILQSIEDLEMREGYGTHASAGILFNHEGPRRGETFVTRKITKWIGEFVKSGRDPEFPKLRLGNLEAFRDWGYAGDYVEAMWAMLQQDQPDDYVICTGETHTIHEFLDVAFKHIGVEDWSGYVVQDPEFYRPAEVDYLRGCNNKALEILGWEPRNSFYDLVKMMVDHDVEN